MAKKMVSGYPPRTYTYKGKVVQAKGVGTYPRTVRNQRHVFDHTEKGTYERDVDTYHRYYGETKYKAKPYREKD